MKWISQRSSEPLFKVRILVDAQELKFELLQIFVTCAWRSDVFVWLHEVNQGKNREPGPSEIFVRKFTRDTITPSYETNTRRYTKYY